MTSKNAVRSPVRFSLDGKKLRGSIQRGHTRDEVLVSALDQLTHQMIAQCYYAGTEESERAAVAQLIKDQDLAHQKLSLDPLYLIPSTLTLIHTNGGSMWWA